ncbi:MAG TPA: hypothetical protein ENH06_01320, partial [bacterium]|nr:hypothetical protein [bacterium]
MEFNLKKSRIWQALKWERVFNFIIFSKKLFFVLFIIVFLLFLYAFIPQNFNTETQKLLLGLSTIFLFITIGSLYKERFFNNLKNPKVKYMIEQAILNPDQYNLAEFLNFEVAKSIWKTIKFCKKKNISPIPSEVLLYFLLDKKEQTNFIFSRGLLGLDEFRKELKAHINNIKKEQFKQVFSFDSEKVILNSLKIAQKKGRNRIKIQDIILSQSQINEIFKKKLIEKDLKQEDIEYLADWLSSLEKKILDGKKWWSWKNLIKKGSLAKEWTS